MPRRPKSTTALGRELEEHVTKIYNGRRSRSSGANRFDKGDVSYDVNVHVDERQGYVVSFLAECKTTEAKSFSLKKATWDKIVEEAHEQGKRPSMFIRFRDPDTGRYTDLVVRDLNDDAEILV